MRQRGAAVAVVFGLFVFGCLFECDTRSCRRHSPDAVVVQSKPSHEVMDVGRSGARRKEDVLFV